MKNNQQGKSTKLARNKMRAALPQTTKLGDQNRHINNTSMKYYTLYPMGCKNEAQYKREVQKWFVQPTETASKSGQTHQNIIKACQNTFETQK